MKKTAIVFLTVAMTALIPITVHAGTYHDTYEQSLSTAKTDGYSEYYLGDINHDGAFDMIAIKENSEEMTYRIFKGDSGSFARLGEITEPRVLYMGLYKDPQGSIYREVAYHHGIQLFKLSYDAADLEFEYCDQYDDMDNATGPNPLDKYELERVSLYETDNAEPLKAAEKPSTADSGKANGGTWTQKTGEYGSKYWSYQFADGTYPVNQWFQDNGHWYYASDLYGDEYGCIVLNEITPDGYFVNPDGQQVDTGVYGKMSVIAGSWKGHDPLTGYDILVKINGDGTYSLTRTSTFSGYTGDGKSGIVKWWDTKNFGLVKGTDLRDGKNISLFKYEDGVIKMATVGEEGQYYILFRKV